MAEGDIVSLTRVLSERKDLSSEISWCWGILGERWGREYVREKEVGVLCSVMVEPGERRWCLKRMRRSDERVPRKNEGRLSHWRLK